MVRLTVLRVETCSMDVYVRRSPHMNLDTLRKILVYLALAFVIVSVWSDPAGSANAAGNFLHEVGGFFSTAIDKGSAFLKGLSD
jgi:hypothetical protein